MNVQNVRLLRPDESTTATETLAASFDDDPWFRWMLPDDRDRRTWLLWFHRVSVANALKEQTAFTLTDGPDFGAINILLPGVSGVSMLGWIRALRSPPRRLPTWRFATTGLRTQYRLDLLHPKQPVVYVHVLGVHLLQKGKGLGGVLLRQALAMAARRGVSVFLETSNPVNLGFYRRFGLQVTHEIHLDGAPPMWTLQTEGPPRDVLVTYF
jgi:GNAT superfamily N-acetyltransferase